MSEYKIGGRDIAAELAYRDIKIAKLEESEQRHIDKHVEQIRDREHFKKQMMKYREQAEELQKTFDLRYAADMRAIKRWHQAGNDELTWPDHVDLVVWLLKEKEELLAQIKNHRETNTCFSVDDIGDDPNSTAGFWGRACARLQQKNKKLEEEKAALNEAGNKLTREKAQVEGAFELLLEEKKFYQKRVDELEKE